MELTTPTATLNAATAEPGVTVLAATDLLSGGRSLYTILVYLLVLLILAGGGTRAAISFFGGRIGSTIAWATGLGHRRRHRRGRLRHLRLDQAHHGPNRPHHRPIRSIAHRPARKARPAP